MVEKDDMIIPIEVKIKAEPWGIERSMRSFIETYQPEIALVVVYKEEKGGMKVNGCSVIFTDVPGMRELLSS